MVREVEDPNFDRPVLHSGVVPHMIEAPGAVRWPGPPIGAHTEEVLRELLAMDDGAIAALRDDGVI
jgi:formyl-CoA transferase